MCPSASIIIVLSDHMYLPQQIEALRQQTVDISTIEIIIVACLNQSYPRVRELSENAKQWLNIQFIAGGQSRSCALNIGVKQATADLLVFLADDFIPDQQWLEGHLNFHKKFEAENMVGIGAGLFSAESRKNPFRRWIEDYGLLWGVRMNHDTKTIPADFFYCANTSIKRSFLQQAGPFNESFIDSAGDDHELGVRLSKTGMQSTFIPQAKTIHDHPLYLAERRRTEKTSGASIALFSEIYPDLPLLFRGSEEPVHVLGMRAICSFVKYLISGKTMDLHSYWENILAASLKSGFEQAKKKLRSKKITKSCDPVPLGNLAIRKVKCQYFNSWPLPKLTCSDEPKLSIIIPVYNNMELTAQCLHGVATFLNAAYEVIVVDDGSDSNTKDMLQEIEGIKVVTNSENVGFSQACNAGAAIAKSSMLLFLNNDAVPQKGAIDNMLESLQKNQQLGVIGARLLYPHSELVQHAGINFSKQKFAYHIFYKADANAYAVAQSRLVPAVTGAMMLTSRSVFNRAGGFCIDYQNGWEDVDFCMRVRQMGLNIFYCAEAIATHHESATEGRLNKESEVRNRELFLSRWRDKIQSISELVSNGEIPYPYPEEYLPTSSTIKFNTGRVVSGEVECLLNRDETGHCFFGPNMMIVGDSVLSIEFNLRIQNVKQADGILLVLDIYDSSASKVLIEREVLADQFDKLAQLCEFQLKVTDGQCLEFRIYWHAKCDLWIEKVSVLHTSEKSRD